MADVTIDDRTIEVSKRAAEDLQPLLDELVQLRTRTIELEIQLGDAEERGAARTPAPKPLPEVKLEWSEAQMERAGLAREHVQRIAQQVEDLSASLGAAKLRLRMKMGSAWVEHDSLPGGHRVNAVAVLHPWRLFAEG